jgi:P27 family predicted phage terminase small subunit
MRGRRPLPAEVKAIKGNPGKRRLALGHSGKLSAKPIKVKAPEWLNDAERKIFTEVVDNYLPRGTVRTVDAGAIGRYVVYFSRWLQCKQWLEGRLTWTKSKSKDGEMLRRHPAAKDLFDYEDKLLKLEDRIGLNPAARQSILRGLAAVPPALGGVLSEDKPKDEEETTPASAEQDVVADEGPLGYLQSVVGKLN